MVMKFGGFLISIFCVLSMNAQIVIDEGFKDWKNAELSWDDASGDGAYGIDFTNMKIDNDDKYLYVFFNIAKEINLQNDNNIALFIDIDVDKNTGYNIDGMGADISYFFGSRYGLYYRNSGSTPFYHSDIGLISLPTVTSDTFELAIKREFKVGSYLVKLSKKIKIFLLQDVQNGDKIPDDSGGVEYIMNDKKLILPEFSMEKSNENQIRIMSYNVEKDHFFENEPPYSRLIKAGKPDVLCFQEIYQHSAVDVKNKIRYYFGGTWYAAKEGGDLIVVSKYPIEKTAGIGGNGAFLINKSGKKILIINNHLYCCDNDSGRQQEVDEIMRFVRKAKAGQGQIPIAKNTAIIILGDMNFVGKNRQRRTLIEGDISNEYLYGNDFLPDWDGTFFEDTKPVTTGFPATFTWNSDYSSYPKGRLDYIIYSGSVLQKENGFVLFTRLLTRDILDTYQMNPEDSDNASDHFPVFIDFSFKKPLAVDEFYDTNKLPKLLSVYPNPASDIATIRLQTNKYEQGVIRIFNVDGQMIMTVDLDSGAAKRINVKSFAPGVYVVEYLSSINGKRDVRKMVVE